MSALRRVHWVYAAILGTCCAIFSTSGSGQTIDLNSDAVQRALQSPQLQQLQQFPQLQQLQQGQLQNLLPSLQLYRPVVPELTPIAPPSRLEALYSMRAGRPLTQFGYDVVGVPSPVSIVQLGAVQDNYVLGEGDEIVVVLRGQDNTTYRQRVNRDGQIILPRLTPIAAAGRNFSEFRAQLQRQIAQGYLSTDAFVSLGEVRQISVLVTGEVRAPGLRNLNALATPLDAILLSGGIAKTGSLRNVTLVRGDQTIAIDLYAILTPSNAPNNIGLRNGDRIFVPPLRNTIAVTGYVRRPGIYELQDNQSAYDAGALIQLAGGIEIPGTYRYSTTHLEADGTTRFIPVSQMTPIAGGEVLFVDPATDVALERVTLGGSIRLAGTYPRSVASSAARLIRSIDDLTLDAYTPFAVVVRRDIRLNVRTLEPFSLTRVLSGAADVTLQNDDVVYIFNRDEIRLLADAATKEQAGLLALQAQAGTAVANAQGFGTAPGGTGAGTLQGPTPSPITPQPPNGNTVPVAPGTPQSVVGTPIQQSVPPGALQQIPPQTNLGVPQYVPGYGQGYGQGFVQGYPPGYGQVYVQGCGPGYAPGYGQGYAQGYTTGVGSPQANPAVQPLAGTTILGAPGSNPVIDPRLQAAQQQITPATSAIAQAVQLSQQSAFSVCAQLSTEAMAARLGVSVQALVRVAADHLVWVLETVRDPGAYIAAEGTTLADMIQTAGGLLRQADLTSIEVTSTQFDPQSGTSRTGRTSYRGQQGDFQRVSLQPLDVIRLRSVFSDRENGQVSVTGQVRYPGAFTITRGERLSSLLERAGGLTDFAYPYGAVFTRERAAIQEREGNLRQARAIDAQLATLATLPQAAAATNRDTLTFLTSLGQQVRNEPVVGRITVTADLATLRTRPDLDLILEPGDTVYIPVRPATVTVSGEVLNSGSFQYQAGMGVSDYVGLAGGATQSADNRRIFIILPDGTAFPAREGWFSFNASAMIPPGSTIVVPRDLRPFDFGQFLRDAVQITSQLAVTGASIAVIGR